MIYHGDFKHKSFQLVLIESFFYFLKMKRSAFHLNVLGLYKLNEDSKLIL